MIRKVIEYHNFRGIRIPVFFVKKAEIAPFFGMAVGGIGKRKCHALVREDLHPILQKFVIHHELYHLQDDKKWLGILGREIRANFSAMIHHPFGFMDCIFATITSKKRICLYWDRIKRKY